MGQMAGPASDRIYRLAYASRANAALPHEAVVNLVASAVRDNRRRGISGVLFSSRGAFAQWLALTALAAVKQGRASSPASALS